MLQQNPSQQFGILREKSENPKCTWVIEGQRPKEKWQKDSIDLQKILYTENLWLSNKYSKMLPKNLVF